MAKGNERDDRRGGIGAGGAQDGPIGGKDSGGRQGQTGEAGGGEGQQRHPGGSSRDSEKLG